MMPLLEKIYEKLDDSPISLAVWVILCLIGFAAVVRNVFSWSGWFEGMLRSSVDGLAPTVLATVKFKPWVFWTCALLISGCAILSAFLARSERKLRRAVKTKDERETIAYKTLQGMMWAATRIRDQHYPAATSVRKAFKQIEMTFRIHTNRTVDVTQKWEIYAMTEPVNFWAVWITATSDASPMEYLDDISFKAVDESGKGVVYLPTHNDPRSKKIVIYFLPRIEPGGTDTRKIQLSYCWPGLFAQLQNKKSEEFSWTTESVEKIERASFIFLLEKGSGFELFADVIGPVHKNEKPVAIGNGDWHGMSYTIENVPSGKCQVGLVLKLKKA